MKYYIAINGQPCGPFDHKQLLENGLTATSLVWCEGMTDWAEAQNVSELAELLFAGVDTDRGAQTGPNVPPYTRQQQPFAQQQQPFTQQPPYTQQAYNTPYTQVPLCPKTWLTESILVTICCCLPCGIVGIVMASQVESLWRQGRYIEADNMSRRAGTWTKVGFWIGLGLSILSCLSSTLVAPLLAI